MPEQELDHQQVNQESNNGSQTDERDNESGQQIPPQDHSQTSAATATTNLFVTGLVKKKNVA